MLKTHVAWECLKQGKHLLLGKIVFKCQSFYRIVPAQSSNNAVAPHLAAVDLRDDLVVPKAIDESALCVLGIKNAAA